MIDKEKNREFFHLLDEVNSFSHAYLFETNSLADAYPYILKFAKKILCEHHYVDGADCNECNICHLIDINSYPDLYVVNPETISIKNDEIVKLLHEFQGKSLTKNGHRVYIIYGIERLDDSLCNKILKFLEEPENNIHAILITENMNMILPTIKSRCQTIKININNALIDENKRKKAELFLNFLFENGNKTIAYTNELFFNEYSERANFVEIFSLIEKILLEDINNYYNVHETKFLSRIPIEKLLSVVRITDKLSKTIVGNINLNLLLDRYIMEVTREVQG